MLGTLVHALKQAAAIAALGALLGVFSNVLGNAEPWGIAWVKQQPRVLAAAPDSAAHPPDHGLSRQQNTVEPRTVTLAQVKRLFDGTGAVFIDARAPYQFGTGHIPGSVNIPWDEFEYYERALERIPRDAVVVIYCDGSSCDLSIHLGDEMAQRGYTRIRVFYEGWAEWTAAGYPVGKPVAEGP